MLLLSSRRGRMLLELTSARRSTLLHPSCEPLGKGEWPNWYLLEVMMDGERAAG